MCAKAYAPEYQMVLLRVHQCKQKIIVSRADGEQYTAWQHQVSVLSTTQGVRLMMRGTAKCNARSTLERENPDKQAIWAT